MLLTLLLVPLIALGLVLGMSRLEDTLLAPDAPTGDVGPTVSAGVTR